MSELTIYSDLLKLLRNNVPCVLATVTHARGSTPQKPGSSAVIGSEGLIGGTIGGGIVEKMVIQKAQHCLLNNESAYQFFNLGNDQSQKDEAICGGNMNILIDAFPARHLAEWLKMEKSLQDRKPGVLQTNIQTTEKSILEVSRHWYSDANMACSDGLDDAAQHSIKERLITPEVTKYNVLDLPSSLCILEPVLPLPQLLICGAGHIGKALSHLGKLLDFEVTVCDDRAEYANKVELPDADRVLLCKASAISKSIKLSADTFVVIVTQGHSNDAEILKSLLNEPLAYLGMIGSKTKIALVRETFLQNSWATPEQWKTIYTPVGLPIGSKTVQEIAISIAAELIMVRNKKTYAHV